MDYRNISLTNQTDIYADDVYISDTGYSVDGTITLLTNDVSNLDVVVSGIQTNINTINGDIQTIEGQIGNIQSDIGNLQSDKDRIYDSNEQLQIANGTKDLLFSGTTLATRSFTIYSDPSGTGHSLTSNSDGNLVVSSLALTTPTTLVTLNTTAIYPSVAINGYSTTTDTNNAIANAVANAKTLIARGNLLATDFIAGLFFDNILSEAGNTWYVNASLSAGYYSLLAFANPTNNRGAELIVNDVGDLFARGYSELGSTWQPFSKIMTLSATDSSYVTRDNCSINSEIFTSPSNSNYVNISPYGWRTAARASMLLHTSTDNPSEIDMRHVSGGINYGWQLSARNGTSGSLMFYKNANNAFAECARIETGGNLVVPNSVSCGKATIGIINIDEYGMISATGTSLVLNDDVEITGTLLVNNHLSVDANGWISCVGSNVHIQDDLYVSANTALNGNLYAPYCTIGSGNGFTISTNGVIGRNSLPVEVNGSIVVSSASDEVVYANLLHTNAGNLIGYSISTSNGSTSNLDFIYKHGATESSVCNITSTGLLQTHNVAVGFADANSQVRLHRTAVTDYADISFTTDATINYYIGQEANDAMSIYDVVNDRALISCNNTVTNLTSATINGTRLVLTGTAPQLDIDSLGTNNYIRIDRQSNSYYMGTLYYQNGSQYFNTYIPASSDSFTLASAGSGGYGTIADFGRSTGQCRMPRVYSETISTRAVYVGSTGILGTTSSSRTKKENIVPITNAGWLLDIQPVEFAYKPDIMDRKYNDETTNITRLGVIAEDAFEVIPTEYRDMFVTRDENGTIASFEYGHMVTPMLKLIKQQQEQIRDLSARLLAVEEKINSA